MDTKLEDLATNSIVPDGKKLTLQEYRKLNRLYFTKRNDKVVACGHKFDRFIEPRTNCEYCWFAWFNENGALTQTCEEMFRKEGQADIVALKGKKFVINFLKFMGTLAKFQKEKQEEEEKKNGKL